jgi:hypothetical protein
MNSVFRVFRGSSNCRFTDNPKNRENTMSPIPTLLARLLSAAAIITLTAQMAVAAEPSAPPPAAAIKAKWTKALEEARRDFQNSNDRESAAFVAGILESLNKPEGLSPAALAADSGQMNSKVRELVRGGALESAATLQTALYHVLDLFGPRASGPANPSQKTGGKPGPGGLVLYLPFDKPDDHGAIHDASGAGNDGLVSGARWVSNGKFGGAYQFCITNLTDRILISNSDLLNPDNITVTAWINTADKDGLWNRIVDKDLGHGYCLSLGGDYDNKLSRGKIEVESSVGNMESGPAMVDGQWHHVAVTYDGKTICCYVDGVGKPQKAGHPGPLKKNGWDLCIGNSVVDYGTGEFIAFDGLIDEVRIYNRALSAAEIKALTTATQAGVDAAKLPADNNAKPSAAERLKQVKSLFEQGLISKEDYDKKVKEIMDTL